MLRVRDIMSTDLLVLEPEISIRDAMASLSTRHVSGAPVIAGEKVVGVVTATDLLDFASALPGVPALQGEPPQTEASETAEESLEGDEPAGAFFHELWDDAGAEVTTRLADVDGPEWDMLAEHVVEEAMNRMVHAVSPDAPVEQAAEYMRDARIHRVLVMNDEKLVGIVSASDIVGAVADHKLKSRTWVFGKGSEAEGPGWVGTGGKVTRPATGSESEDEAGRVDGDLNQGPRPDDKRR